MSGLPVIGPPTVSVPGVVRAWAMLLERFGSRSLDALLGPAIHYAERGFPITSILSQGIAEFAPGNPDPEWRRVFLPGGKPPAPGEMFVQPDLARTLRDLAAEGPDLFYRGRVARAIAERMEADGFLTLDDLGAPHRRVGRADLHDVSRLHGVRDPAADPGRDRADRAQHPGGCAAGRKALHSVEHLHLLLEVTKLAYADRDRWIGDPAQARVPVAGMLDKAYAAERLRHFDPRKAQVYVPGQPEGDTTGFVVADGHGNVAQRHPEPVQRLRLRRGPARHRPLPAEPRPPLHADDPAIRACSAPRKRPFHTLMASITTRDDRPLMGFATMGGNGQAMFHVQVLTNVFDYGLDIQEAIERPRFLDRRVPAGRSGRRDPPGESGAGAASSPRCGAAATP